MKGQEGREERRKEGREGGKNMYRILQGEGGRVADDFL